MTHNNVGMLLIVKDASNALDVFICDGEAYVREGHAGSRDAFVHKKCIRRFKCFGLRRMRNAS